MTTSARVPPARLAADARLEDLAGVLAEPTRLTDYAHAVDMTQEVLVYDASSVRRGEQGELVGG